MEKKESSTAISSLLSQYGDASDEELINDGPSSVDNISDEEAEEKKEQLKSKSESVLTFDENSSSSTKMKEFSDTPVKKRSKKAKLVSYVADDHDEDKSSTEEDTEEEDGYEKYEITAHVINVSKGGSCLESEVASSLSRSVLYMPHEDIKLPPEPTGKCSRSLQEKISNLYEKMRREGLNMNAQIQRRKDFRNPSIYEKLIDFCSIDSNGSNFPPEIYNPYLWSKDSYYDELDKVQKKEMEKREKDRKDRTKVEFVTVTKKASSTDSYIADDKKRKTKWDSLPSIASLTSSVTGTKSTVIPAGGNISKKSK